MNENNAVFQEKSRDPEAEYGFYRKYFVQRLYGDDVAGTSKLTLTRENGEAIEPSEKHAQCETFVLDLVHDRYARYALEHYVQYVEREYPQLAQDLRRVLNLSATRAREAHNARYGL